MKRLLLAALLAMPCAAHASPYFRIPFVTGGQVKPVLGALLDTKDLGQSEAASLMPLLTHSPKDGCLMPSIVCEDWTPIAVGASMNAGKITFDVAPLANVLPFMQRGALALIPDKWSGIRALLAPTPDAPVTFSAGPVWQYRQLTNKGYFKVFTGLALSF